jgi:bis(5'-adenosyl)-triphosphatase
MTAKGIRRSNCEFCQESTSERAFSESANFYAIYNISPVVAGHSLIIPKDHVDSLMELPDVEYQELTVFAREVTATLLRAFQTKSFDWALQNGDSAGQSIPHLHLHVLPRRPADLPNPDAWLKSIPGMVQGIDPGSRRRLSEDQQFLIGRWLESFQED